jgi:hypothetical protein
LGWIRYARYGVIAERILVSAVFAVNGLGIIDPSMAAKELPDVGLSGGLLQAASC